MSSPATHKTTLQRLGRFLITEAIGSGGMATIHLAHAFDGSTNGPIALKRLKPEFASDASFVEMFLDEARLACHIVHPNVVRSYEVVEEEGEVFLVMEYVHGETLQYFLRGLSARGERIPAAVAALVLSKMLRGLHAAHMATDENGVMLNVIHRDVSPQNVMISRTGEVRLLDFGIAKGRGGGHRTAEGQIKGKLSFMSPEQLRGHQLTSSTDIFSAGITLWHCLTGKSLFTGKDDADTVYRILQEPVPPPSSIDPSIPGALDDVVLRALQRNPSARFQSAQEMANALDGLRLGADESALGEWVSVLALRRLDTRQQWMADVERASSEVRSRASGPRGTDLMTDAELAAAYNLATSGKPASAVPVGANGLDNAPTTVMATPETGPVSLPDLMVHPASAPTSSGPSGGRNGDGANGRVSVAPVSGVRASTARAPGAALELGRSDDSPAFPQERTGEVFPGRWDGLPAPASHADADEVVIPRAPLVPRGLGSASRVEAGHRSGESVWMWIVLGGLVAVVDFAANSVYGGPVWLGPVRLWWVGAALAVIGVVWHIGRSINNR